MQKSLITYLIRFSFVLKSRILRVAFADYESFYFMLIKHKNNLLRRCTNSNKYKISPLKQLLLKAKEIGKFGLSFFDYRKF